ncbi:class I SAM-dependent methyltransferase [Gynuella sunshinyii]|uniref:16S RNA G1207 methylase RsmC n=1 Tax=Gynuella sunshinyii YC6258 TaxID=1445510 RepID=A0A0C5VZN0_9GAMM|nr:class I SAM-dependent methyltransferase [Gynuella sunshinyii]AJQ95884.1 16S RNA G1207 methylase RsmC [Gynuella sunshinyii YC6258]
MTEPLFNTPAGTFILKRDSVSQSVNLRAWDAADEYLLDIFHQSPAERIIVINDHFGALSIPLSTYIDTVWSDSFLSVSAIHENAAANQIPAHIHITRADEIPTARVSLALMRIPKNNQFFGWQLKCLHHLLPVNAELWLAGMDKHITKSQFDMVADIFGPVEFLPGRKKARIWKARKTDERQHSIDLFKSGYQLDKYQLSMQQTPNVFSGNRPDSGSLFLLEQLTSLQGFTHIADSGCGNGLLSLVMARNLTQAHITAVDESFQAVACCQENARQNNIDNITVSAGNGLQAYGPNSFDLVLCNPPFHQGTTLTEQLAYWMFKTAAHTLRTNGELWVVANRHLDYPKILRGLFGHSQMVKQNNRFKVYRVQKSRNKQRSD